MRLRGKNNPPQSRKERKEEKTQRTLRLRGKNNPPQSRKERKEKK